MDTTDDTRIQTTAIIIANPTAGSYTQHVSQINETITCLHNAGWEVELKLTQEQGDGRRLTREAVEQKLSAVIVVGGDGTINEVIQELAGSETALAVLPGGTVNVWARETGIPLDIVQARDVLLNGQTQLVDLGKVDDRYFLLMASMGLDAEITHAVEQKAAKRFGVLGYILKGTWLGFGYGNFQAILQTGKHTRRVRVLQIVFGNTQLYAGAVKFTWQARCDDGLLDVCIVPAQNVFGRVQVLFDFLLRRKKRRQHVLYETVQEMKLHTRGPVALQVDGDPIGFTAQEGSPPTVFAIMPAALKVIIPTQGAEKLFGAEKPVL